MFLFLFLWLLSVFVVTLSVFYNLPVVMKGKEYLVLCKARVSNSLQRCHFKSSVSWSLSHHVNSQCSYLLFTSEQAGRRERTFPLPAQSCFALAGSRAWRTLTLLFTLHWSCVWGWRYFLFLSLQLNLISYPLRVSLWSHLAWGSLFRPGCPWLVMPLLLSPQCLDHSCTLPPAFHLLSCRCPQIFLSAYGRICFSVLYWKETF